MKEEIKHFYDTNKRVVETEAFEEEFTSRFNVGLIWLGEVVRMTIMKLKRRGFTWPTAKEAGPLPELTFRETATWLQLAPLYSRA